jgi:RNA polymerase sigma-70 factor (ECF subfamily)
MSDKKSFPGDARFLAALAAGEEWAFQSLYDLLGERLYRVALALLGRKEDAEDAVQDVFLSLVRCRNRLLHVANLPAYIFTALRRAAAQVAASRARVPGPLHTEEPAGAEDRSPGPRADRLERALRALPEEQREVLHLKIEGELSFAEIAGVLGVSLNTAASRYRRALEKLRDRLKEHA